LKDEIKSIVSVISIAIHIWPTLATCQFIFVLRLLRARVF